MNNAKKVIILILSYSLLSCATVGYKHVTKDYDLTKEPTKSIVIGKVNIDQSGVIGILTSSAIGFKNLSNGKYLSGIPKDKYFFITLDEGEYRFTEIYLAYGLIGALIGALGAYDASVPVLYDFKVDPREIIYIGDLSVKGTFRPLSSPPVLINKEIEVSDEFDNAVNEFKKLYPNIKGDITKKLMHANSR